MTSRPLISPWWPCAFTYFFGSCRSLCFASLASQNRTFGESLGDDFHIWEAEWDENRITVSLDGVHYFSRAIDPATMEEFRRDFFLIFQHADGDRIEVLDLNDKYQAMARVLKRASMPKKDFTKLLKRDRKARKRRQLKLKSPNRRMRK